MDNESVFILYACIFSPSASWPSIKFNRLLLCAVSAWCQSVNKHMVAVRRSFFYSKDGIEHVVNTTTTPHIVLDENWKIEWCAEQTTIRCRGRGCKINDQLLDDMTTTATKILCIVLIFNFRFIAAGFNLNAIRRKRLYGMLVMDEAHEMYYVDYIFHCFLLLFIFFLLLQFEQ